GKKLALFLSFLAGKCHCYTRGYARVPDLELTVTRPYLAAVMGVTEQHVGALAIREGLPRRGRGQYYLPDVWAWAMTRAKGGDDDARTRLYRAQTEKTELDVEIARHQHIPADEVQQAMVELLAILLNVCDSLPQRAAQGVVGCGSVAEAVHILEENCHAVRADLASTLAAVGKDVAAVITDSDTSAPAKRRGMGKRRAPRATAQSSPGKVAK
ncbi:MAG: DUF1441 family protein, partial [Gammaproteobacteria bacterium]|nr:DUF1441 family protein [Gammaproteobacteria bacterium]